MYNFKNYDRQVDTTLSLMTNIVTEIRNFTISSIHFIFQFNKPIIPAIVSE